MLGKISVGKINFPVNKQIRLTVLIDKSLKTSLTYINGKRVTTRQIRGTFPNLRVKKPLMKIGGGKNLTARFCNIQVWTEVKGRNFLKDLFANKRAVAPGNVLCPVDEFTLKGGAKKEAP